ncbi:MAG: helix-turn-helix transcriptional regulator [Desulfotomaculaceae bacterium]|nr:helix-turn-helix transcriptional regulator [Desulfotomaculaceae bacterium]
MSLAAVRKSKNILAKEMAERVGLSVLELRAIEEGRQTPRVCVAQIWANALGLTFEEYSRHYYAKADPDQLCEE